MGWQIWMWVEDMLHFFKRGWYKGVGVGFKIGVLYLSPTMLSVPEVT